VNIGIAEIVWLMVYLLIAAVILGLVWWLIGYIEKQGFGPPIAFKVIRIVFVVLVVLFVIGMLLSFAGFPIVRFH
jgi:asparagine N-glycosylation enzyme membrane subunit Stt3